MKQLNNKKILLFLLSFLAVTMLVSSGISAYTATLCETVAPFQILTDSALQFGFQDERYILLTVQIGVLTASNARLSITDSDARLTFTPSLPCTFIVNSPSDTEYTFQTTGVTVTQNRDDYQIDVSKDIAATLYWRIANASLPSLPSLNVNWFWTYLYNGDFIGLFNALLASAFSAYTIAVGFIIMLFMVPLYLRTKSLALMAIIWLLLGTFIIAIVPDLAALSMIFWALGITGILYRLFRPSRD